ncbi:ABC transporter ATP-binding protein [Coprococcus sp. AF21-14LB]|uniref:ABC transporter ATP-binding protein n=1 Tax=Coprococcus sp. AF21-14LB TaxID=2292231 RepID=UPI000E51EFDB|nr:ABC transporter ATP-binding protein [Coprococcus sp. AF21-14LB]RGS77620.1 ABC transporter ATP-binding protein [Coprococcus sp. AF21-14LB]
MELKISRVTKQFSAKIAVDKVSLQMQPGVYGLLGANGAGKTTLLRMICGVLSPDSGEISLDRFSVKEEEYRNCLGYLPQEFGYYPNFTAWDFMMYMAALKGIPRNKAKVRIEKLLEAVNLKGSEKKKIAVFSGGMKQRLGIAQALLNNPKLLVLDEPTAGLDPKERVKFRNMISRLGQDRIVILSTHIVSDIEYIADEILLMKEGTILQKGSLPDILEPIQGKVWECKVNPAWETQILEQYAVVNMREGAEGAFLRVVGEQRPSADAVSVEAALEDLYLYYFKGEGGE